MLLHKISDLPYKEMKKKIMNDAKTADFTNSIQTDAWSTLREIIWTNSGDTLPKTYLFLVNAKSISDQYAIMQTEC